MSVLYIAFFPFSFSQINPLAAFALPSCIDIFSSWVCDSHSEINFENVIYLFILLQKCTKLRFKIIFNLLLEVYFFFNVKVCHDLGPMLCYLTLYRNL